MSKPDWMVEIMLREQHYGKKGAIDTAQAIRAEMLRREPEEKEIPIKPSMMESMDRMDCTIDKGYCREIGYNQALSDVKEAME